MHRRSTTQPKILPDEEVLIESYIKGIASFKNVKVTFGELNDKLEHLWSYCDALSWTQERFFVTSVYMEIIRY